jgi:hypothetical protein
MLFDDERALEAHQARPAGKVYLMENQGQSNEQRKQVLAERKRERDRIRIKRIRAEKARQA